MLTKKEAARLVVYATTSKFSKEIPIQHAALSPSATCSQMNFSEKRVVRAQTRLYQSTGSRPVYLHTAFYNLTAGSYCLWISPVTLFNLLSSLKYSLITYYSLINDL